MSELLASMGYFSGINSIVDPKFLTYAVKDVSGIGNKAVYPLEIGANIYIDNTYHINSRGGQTLLLSGTTKNLWANIAGTLAFCTKGSNLYQLKTDYTVVLLLSGLDTNNLMSYLEWNDRVYFSNGVNIGYIKNSIAYPLSVPVVINPDKMTGGITASEPMPYKRVMPPGQYLAVYRGHLLSASDNVLYVSDALSDCYDVRGSIQGTGRSYIPFNGDITMVRPVDEGIYVADGNTWFLRGAAFEDMEKRLVESSQVAPFSDINVDAELIGKGEGKGRWAVWISGKGIMTGDNNGNVENITDPIFNMPNIMIGAAMIKNVNGLVQYFGVIS